MLREDYLWREYQENCYASAAARIAGREKEAKRLLEIAISYHEELVRERIEFIKLCNNYEQNAAFVRWH